MGPQTGTHRIRSEAGATVKTILVVENHPCLCDVIAAVLQRCGYRVLSATSGDQARAVVRQTSTIDLLLAAIEIPETSGFESLEWFRTAQPRADVIFTSNERAEAWPPFAEHIERPFIFLDAMIRKVRAVLERTPATPPTAIAA
jgi:two-component system NtrC family sensor kinase